MDRADTLQPRLGPLVPKTQRHGIYNCGHTGMSPIYDHVHNESTRHIGRGGERNDDRRPRRRPRCSTTRMAGWIWFGWSDNVAKPTVSLGHVRNAVVASCDAWACRTGRLAEHTRQATVLVITAGVAGLIAESMSATALWCSTMGSAR